jgi:hypothetical protein
MFLSCLTADVSVLETADSVDSVVTVDYNGRGAVSTLYNAARKIQAGPLCAMAAERLARARTLMFVTGFRTLRYGGVYETDGFVSTCLLARRLVDYGVDAVVVVDEGFENVARAGVGTGRVGVRGAPISRELCASFIKSLLKEFGPDTAVFVERPGANRLNQYHNMYGENISALHAPLDAYIPLLKERGVSVVAFGDGGNEAGMGVIREAVVGGAGFGTVCRCGCGGGIVAATSADVLVVSSVSDLGVYGAVALYEPSILREVSEEAVEVVKALLRFGVVDVLKGPGYAGVDGVGLESIKSIISILLAVTRSGVRRQ